MSMNRARPPLLAARAFSHDCAEPPCPATPRRQPSPLFARTRQLQENGTKPQRSRDRRPPEGVPMAVYTLPDLPYDYGALEPAMSGQTLELHHSKHHAAYVKGANDTLEKL